MIYRKNAWNKNELYNIIVYYKRYTVTPYEARPATGSKFVYIINI